MIRRTIAAAVGAAFAFAALAQDKPKPPPAWHQGPTSLVGQWGE